MADSRAPGNGTGRPGASGGGRGDDSLIEYPSRFPIKVMGLQADGFARAIAVIAKEFDPDFDETTMEHRPSSAGKYLGITISVKATSREQLDALYRALTMHPMVKVVL
jgi:putative lipoic acid-binding regulatory protein